MPDKLKLHHEERDRQSSCFDWINIDRGPARIGKIRARIGKYNLTIYSIYIFPQFEGNGYARKIIEIFKSSFPRIYADRVRHTAVGFWIKMGFKNDGKGGYVYENNYSRLKV